MTRLFRSKSCGLVGSGNMFNSAPPSPPLYLSKEDDDGGGEEEDEEEWDGDFDGFEAKPISTPLINSGSKEQIPSNNNQFPIVAVLVTALRKSLVTCSVETDGISSMDISPPTNVRHVSHVTFDRFNGFLGLPADLQPEVPRRVPSASASVFGVSAKSMQCSYDEKGNSVPTILLMMQKRLYSEGGLQAEGIFRINAENSQEEYVRKQLNKGAVPRGIDVHCLAGLIKAWLRELPTGVLDSLTPEQVMHCNTEDECTKLVKLLPPMEAALLNWAINLMADVVQHEHQNKMNARNIAMVFAPNMTQMADPLTALIHAVQVMNLLKTLIMKTIREREDSVPPHDKIESRWSNSNRLETCAPEELGTVNFVRTATLNRLESDKGEIFWSFRKQSDGEEDYESISGGSTPVMCKMVDSENGYDNGEVEGILDRLSLRKGVRKLCKHPVFQLSKPVKKREGLRGGGGEAWA